MDMILTVAALLVWMVLVSLSWMGWLVLSNQMLGMAGLVLALVIVVVWLFYRVPAFHRARSTE